MLIFFEAEFQSIVRTDENDVLRVISNIPYSNDDNKQTLFFVSFGYGGELKRSAVSDHVKDKYERKQCDVVMLCFGFVPLCRQSKDWLRRQNFLHEDYFTLNQLNPHLHRILMDLTNNPHYNWRQRYTQYGSMCQTKKQENIYFWEVDDPTVYPYISTLYLIIVGKGIL